MDKKYGEIIQLGDVGLGFHGCKGLKLLPKHFRFFRGNHDNPAVIRKHPRFMGEYGVDPRTGVFFVGGAGSIDRHLRVEGRDWWPDEELSMSQLQAAIDLYEKTKPEVVATHTCPESLIDWVLNEDRGHIIGKGNGKPFRFPPDRTSVALQRMLDIHRPAYWVFGHYHYSCSTIIDGTKFQCLAEREIETITILKIWNSL